MTIHNNCKENKESVGFWHRLWFVFNIKVTGSHEIFLVEFSMLQIEIKSVPVVKRKFSKDFPFCPHKLMDKIISTQWGNNEAIFRILEIDRKGIKYTGDYIKSTWICSRQHQRIVLPKRMRCRAINNNCDKFISIMMSCRNWRRPGGRTETCTERSSLHCRKPKKAWNGKSKGRLNRSKKNWKR